MMPTMRSRALVCVACVAAIAIGFVDAARAQRDSGTPAIEAPRVTPFEFDGDVRDLGQLSATAASPKPYRPLRRGPPRGSPGLQLPPAAAPSSIGGPRPPMPATTQNFAGVSSNDDCGGSLCGGGFPPDPNGDVGPNHIILAVNTSYAIYNKTGTRLAAFTEDALWAATGSNPCNGNSQGDPIVVYDRLADRWVLTHFAFAVDGFGDPVSPFFQCVAASKTADPVSGGWWLYPLRIDTGGAGEPPVGSLNDYGKFGSWSDCFYMAANQFSGPTFDGISFASLSRADMYSGAPLTWALGFLPFPAHDVFTLVPSHNLGIGPNAPSPGTPNYYVNETSLEGFAWVVRKFTAGPNCGAGGTMSAPVNVSQGAYNFCFDNIVPQPNTSIVLSAIGDRIMQKVIYRKVSGIESLWTVHAIADGECGITPPTKTSVQWAQIDVTGGNVAATPAQEGVHSPDSLWRFIPSIAADGRGNMAVGYSTSGPTEPNFPSIKYAGRLAGDPPNTLPQTEQVLIAGGGSQTNQCGGFPCSRWGDYSSMSVDPIDDCAFWYINQYYDNQTSGTAGNWHTRIGSFKFPTCTAPTTGAARTFVSVNGNDANPCTPSAPCRLLSHALTVTTAGGEIQVLDSGGYGGLTIDRPVTIAASEGVYAGISVSSGTGINVNSGPAGAVTLRGLTINSVGGTTGIAVTSTPALHIERCTISGFTNGIVATPAAGTSLSVRHSALRNNSGNGVLAGPSASGIVRLELDNAAFERNGTGLGIAQRGAVGAIRNSVFTGNATGIAVAPTAGNTGRLEIRRSSFHGNSTAGLSVGSAGATAIVSVAASLFSNGGVGILTQQGASATVADSTITRNTLGLQQLTGGTAVSFSNNRLLNNTTDGSFTSSTPLQ